MIEMSKSRLVCYLTCGQQFKYKYIEEKEAPPSIVMKRGIDVHDDINKFFDMFDTSKITDPEKQFKEILIKVAEERFGKYQTFYESFINYELWRWDKLGKSFVFRGTLNKFFKPVYKELNIKHKNLTGIIDRVDFIPGIGYILLDYKTGGIYEGNMIKLTGKEIITELQSEEKIYAYNNYMLELGLYSFLFEKIYRKRVAKVGVIGLKDKKRFLTDLTVNDINNSLRILKLAMKMIENEEFETVMGRHCYCCPFKIICSVWRR